MTPGARPAVQALRRVMLSTWTIAAACSLVVAWFVDESFGYLAALGHPRRALSALRRRTYMSGWPAYLATAWKDESRLARIVGDVQRAALSTSRVAALRAASISVTQTLGSP